jgi:hypothetical protein
LTAFLANRQRGDRRKGNLIAATERKEHKKRDSRKKAQKTQKKRKENYEMVAGALGSERNHLIDIGLLT